MLTTREAFTEIENQMIRTLEKTRDEKIKEFPDYQFRFHIWASKDLDDLCESVHEAIQIFLHYVVEYGEAHLWYNVDDKGGDVDTNSIFTWKKDDTQ